MTRRFMRVSAPLALAIAGALTLSACGDAPAKTESHAAEEAEKRGPHGGRMLYDGDLSVEITIFEDGVEPEFRVYAYRKEKPLAPGQVQLKITLTRLDGEVNRFSFKPEGDYLRGQGVVTEQHSFTLGHGGGTDQARLGDPVRCHTASAGLRSRPKL